LVFQTLPSLRGVHFTNVMVNLLLFNFTFLFILSLCYAQAVPKSVKFYLSH
jgi:hypothetical protein